MRKKGRRSRERERKNRIERCQMEIHHARARSPLSHFAAKGSISGAAAAAAEKRIYVYTHRHSRREKRTSADVSQYRELSFTGDKIIYARADVITMRAYPLGGLLQHRYYCASVRVCVCVSDSFHENWPFIRTPDNPRKELCWMDIH